MSITTYNELKTAAANWLARADMATNLDDLIMAGEKHVTRRVRSREMEADLSIAITDGLGSIPSDYVELKYAHMSTGNQGLLDIKPAHWLITQYPLGSTADTPRYVAVEGSFFKLAPRGSGTMVGTYYKRLTPITASGVHSFFLNNPDLYLFSTLAESKAFLMDDSRIAKWETKRDEIINQINGESMKSHYGNGMAIRTR